MSTQITINGADKTAYLQAGTLRLDWKLGQRSTGQMMLVDTTGTYRPVVGQEVAVFKAGTRIWGGTIDEIDESRIGGEGSAACEQSCMLVGYEGRLDKRFIYQTVYGGHFSAVVSTSAFAVKAHSLSNGLSLQVYSTGTLPGGLAVSTRYWVVNKTADHFQVALSAGGTAVSITSVGSGAHSFALYCGDIIADILVNKVSGEIANASGNIQLGALAGILAIEYQSAAEIFDQLAATSQYIWYVDADQNFFFVPRATYTAPFSLTDSTHDARNIQLRRTREDLQNRQLRIVSFAGFAVEAGSFTGNSADTEFDLTYPVGKIESMLLDGVAVDFGIWGSDTGKDWYYNIGEHRIRQDAGGAVLSAAQTLTVDYRGFGRNLLVVDDSGAIAARAAIEGGSGAYERLVDDGQNADAVGALRMANSDIALYKNIVGQLRFESDTDGLRPGQILSVALTTPSVTASFLVDSVSAQDVDASFFRYSVTALDGSRIITWVNYFQALAGGGASSGAVSTGAGGGGGGAPGRPGWNVMVPSGGHVTPDLGLGQNQVVSATANLTVDAPTFTGGTFAAGDEIWIWQYQDATGGRTLIWNAIYKGMANADPDLTPTCLNVFKFAYNGTNFQLVAAIRGTPTT